MVTNLELAPFLAMNGRAKEAIDFYEKHLKAQVVFLKTYADMKEYDPGFEYEDVQADCISHSVLLIGESQLLIADEPFAGANARGAGSAISLCLQSKDYQAVKGVYDSLVTDQRVQVLIPFEKSIFSEGYAVIVDPFGIAIQINVDAG